MKYNVDKDNSVLTTTMINIVSALIVDIYIKNVIINGGINNRRLYWYVLPRETNLLIVTGINIDGWNFFPRDCCCRRAFQGTRYLLDR